MIPLIKSGQEHILAPAKCMSSLFNDLKNRIMTKDEALDAVEKAIDLAFDKGKELSIHSVIGCFKTLEECENESIKFTREKLKVVSAMLSDDYKTGYKEGVEHYLQNGNNL